MSEGRRFCNLLIDVVSGLKELLNHGILYRDIHLNNIYLSETKIDGRYIYKLGDFGSCSFVDGYSQYENLTEKGGIGSKWYMAPETLKSEIFDERSAVYGVGMIAYYLLNDLYPPLWQDYGEEAILQRMKISKLPKPSLLNKCVIRHFNFDFIDNALRKMSLKDNKLLMSYWRILLSFCLTRPLLRKQYLLKERL